MESSDIIRIINGVKLHIDGKADLSKYGFKATKRDDFVLPWLTKIVLDEKDAIILGCALAWNGRVLRGQNKEDLKSLLEEWKYRYKNPSSIFTDVDIECPADLRALTKETVNGCHLFQGLRQKSIHPITFLYLDALLDVSSKWSSVHWKIYQKRVNALKKVLDIDRSRVVKLGMFLKSKFTENNNE